MTQHESILAEILEEAGMGVSQTDYPPDGCVAASDFSSISVDDSEFYQPPILGVSIMPEGFITNTGIVAPAEYLVL